MQGCFLLFSFTPFWCLTTTVCPSFSLNGHVRGLVCVVSTACCKGPKGMRIEGFPTAAAGGSSRLCRRAWAWVLFCFLNCTIVLGFDFFWTCAPPPSFPFFPLCFFLAAWSCLWSPPRAGVKCESDFFLPRPRYIYLIYTVTRNTSESTATASLFESDLARGVAVTLLLTRTIIPYLL